MAYRRLLQKERSGHGHETSDSAERAHGKGQAGGCAVLVGGRCARTRARLRARRARRTRVRRRGPRRRRRGDRRGSSCSAIRMSDETRREVWTARTPVGLNLEGVRARVLLRRVRRVHEDNLVPGAGQKRHVRHRVRLEEVGSRVRTATAQLRRTNAPGSPRSRTRRCRSRRSRSRSGRCGQ